MRASRSKVLPANAAGGCGPGGGLVASRLCVVDDVDAGEEAQVLVAAGVRNALVAALATFPSAKNDEDGGDGETKAGANNAAAGEATAKLAVPETLADTVSLQVGASLKSDVMSVAKCGRIVAASDGLGAGVLVRMPETLSDIVDLVPMPMTRRTVSEDDSREPSAKRMRIDIGGCLKWDAISPHAMPGWSGAAFPRSTLRDSQDPELVAVTHGFSQETQIVDVFTGACHSRIVHAQLPTATAFMDAHTLITLEWGTVTLWDIRTSKPVKIPGSLSAERQPYLAVDVSDDATVFALANEARAVSVVDFRSWRTLTSWRAPIKYEPVAVRLVGSDNRCFVAGRDHELVGCRVADMSKKQATDTPAAKTPTPQSVPAGSLLYQNHRTFRSEDSWAGIDLCVAGPSKTPAVTDFVGLTTSGVLYAGCYSI